MKIFLMICISSLLSANAITENTKITFYVTHVKGEILLQRTSKNLRVGDKIYENDKIQFRSSGAQIGAITSSGLRYKTAKKELESQFNTVISTFLHGKKSAADRDVSFTSLSTIKQYFAGSDLEDESGEHYLAESLMIFDHIDYPIFAIEYTPSAEQYYYAEYTKDGKIEQLKFFSEDKNLLISRQELEYIAPIARIFLHKQEGENLFINEFKPVLADEKAIEQELFLIIKFTRNKYDKNLDLYEREISPYLEEFYGKIEEISLKEWLKSSLKFDINK